MGQTNHADDTPSQDTLPAFERLPLSELFPHWSNLLWLQGMRPMLHDMLHFDLRLSESLILRQLRYRSLTIAEVAEYLSITHSAASRAADRLVREGFVSRRENPADRRQKVLSLTAHGTALVQALEGKFTAGVEFLVDSLSPEEQEQFRQLIVRMVAANCRAPGAPGPQEELDTGQR